MGKRLKIAHIVLELDVRRSGGTARFLQSLLLHIDRQQTENVIIVGQSHPSAANYYSDLEIPIFNDLENVNLCCNCSQGKGFGTIKHLMQMLRHIKPHIVHTHSHWADCYGRESAFRTNIPVIISTEHNSIPAETLQYRSSKRRLAQKSDRIVCVSEAVKQYACQTYALSEHLFSVIYNGISLQNYNFYKLDRRNNKSYKYQFVYVARLEPQKAPQRIIQAFSILCTQGYDCQLQIIGDGSLRSECEVLIQQLGISSQVELRGYHAEPWQQIDCSEFINTFVLTSNYEGLCLAVLEAMALGYLCILPNLAALLEIAEDHQEAIFYEAGNLDQLVEKMKLAIAMPLQQRQSMAIAARHKIETKFNAAYMAEQYLCLYQNLYAQKHCTLN